MSSRQGLMNMAHSAGHSVSSSNVVEAELFQETDLALHEHCFTCILPYRCQYLLPEHQLGCPVVNCSLNCGAKFHACKSQEHLLLCPQMKVPCTNIENGCPMFLRRRDINAHLSSCPASVVYCSAEWNRKPLSLLTKKHMKKIARRRKVSGSQTNSDENTTWIDDHALDVAFALNDQAEIQGSYSLLRSVRKKATNRFNQYHAQLPGVRDYLEQDMIPLDELQRCIDIDSSDEDEEEEKRKFKKVATVMKDCAICKYDPGSQHLHQLGRGDTELAADQHKQAETMEELSIEDGQQSFEMAFPNIYTKNNLFLNLSLDFLPSTVKKPRTRYTIVCSQLVRRDEFYWHYKNLHNDVINSLDGWAWVRCPLMQYGCTELFERLVPQGVGQDKIRYNSQLSTFTVSANEATTTNSHKEQLEYMIPREIWLEITSYLDGASLLCLASTCRLLRTVCAEILSEKGIVVQKWNKISGEHGVSWVQGPPVWTFSKCFHPISTWTMQTNADMLNHTGKCPAFHRKQFSDQKIPVLRFLFNKK